MSEGRDGPEDTNGAATENEGIELLRREVLASLPKLLDKAIQGYSRFSTDSPPDDTKGFVAYQAACRAALAHIQLLVKLAHWARGDGDEAASSTEAEQLDRMVREAEAALQSEPIEDD